MGLDVPSRAAGTNNWTPSSSSTTRRRPSVTLRQRERVRRALTRRARSPAATAVRLDDTQPSPSLLSFRSVCQYRSSTCVRFSGRIPGPSSRTTTCTSRSPRPPPQWHADEIRRPEERARPAPPLARVAGGRWRPRGGTPPVPQWVAFSLARTASPGDSCPPASSPTLPLSPSKGTADLEAPPASGRNPECSSSGTRDSNSRPSAWEADALPTELVPRSPRHGYSQTPPAVQHLRHARRTEPAAPKRGANCTRFGGCCPYAASPSRRSAFSRSPAGTPGRPAGAVPRSPRARARR